MLGQTSMPTAQLVAVLAASPPPRGMAVLTALTPDRIAALLDALPDDQRHRLLSAATAAQWATVLAACPDEQLPTVLGRLPVADAAARAADLPADRLGRLLTALPPDTRFRLAAALPDARVEDLADRPELARTLYERRAGAALARMAPLTRLPGDACDLALSVLNQPVLAAVRPAPGPGGLSPDDVHAAARATDWTRFVALVVVTDLAPAPAATTYATDLRTTGYPVELTHWTTDRDDPTLKRLLARL